MKFLALLLLFVFPFRVFGFVLDDVSIQYPLKDYSYIAGEVSLEIQRVDVIPDGLQVQVRAFNGLDQYGFGSDGSVEFERINIINPPVFVPSGEKEYIDVVGVDKPILVDTYVYDPELALKLVLADTIALIGKLNTNIELGKIGNTTTVVYPDPSVESTSVDGVVRNTNANWDIVHDASSGNYADDNDADNVIGYDNQIELWRGFFLFDTSSIPDTDIISSAVLSLYVSSKDDTNNDSIGVVSSTPESNTAISTADFDAVGTTDFATRKDIGSDITTSAYNDFTLNASGISAVSLTGISKFAVRTGKDIDDINPSPTGNNRIIVHMADNASNDPKLTIEHSASGGGGGGGGSASTTPLIAWSCVDSATGSDCYILNTGALPTYLDWIFVSAVQIFLLAFVPVGLVFSVARLHKSYKRGDVW